MATKKKATKKSKAASPKKKVRKSSKKKAAAKPTKREPSFAEFLDAHMIVGISWAKLEELAKAEADRRHITSQRTVAALQAHARSRSYLDQWTVTMDDKGVKMTRSHKEESK